MMKQIKVGTAMWVGHYTKDGEIKLVPDRSLANHFKETDATEAALALARLGIGPVIIAGVESPKTLRERVMDFVEEHGSVQRWEIVKFIVEECHGRVFDKRIHRGIFSAAFQTHTHRFSHQEWECVLTPLPVNERGYFMRPSKNDRRFLVKLPNGRYAVGLKSVYSY